MKRPPYLIPWLMTLALLPGLALSKEAKDSSLDRVKKAGILLIALDPTYPPMEFEGIKQKVEGFDVDFGTEVGRRLGVKTEFVVMNWDGILAGLNSGRYDIIVSSMNITPDRAKVVDFVPYFKLVQVFVTKVGQAVKTSDELAGKVVAVQADTTSHAFVEKEQKRGVKIKDIRAFKLATDTFAAIKSGHADVTVIDEPVGRYYAKQEAQTFTVSGEAMSAEPVGIAVKKADHALKAAIEQAVVDIQKDGTYKALSTKWFGKEMVL